ncbi:hypothetical protein Aple_058580 [Acrocarpospora pleiomorpha]|uniref:Uncharacterized protein n=1 Tax=Acrocarpospora pleiomorpha TaxID=90975 RepID=A0A5M3XSL4_9ACTN|nr:hypothetical protein Aple_058580 [Acrocarpospora pleiomorpha]
MIGVDLGQQGRHLVPVGHVTRHDRDLDTVGDQLGPQLLRARSIQAPPADQQQMPYVALGHQMPREQRAQTTGPTSDQHRAVRIPRPFDLGAGHDPHQPGHPRLTTAHRHLRLIGGEHPGQHRPGQLPIDIHQDKPPRILRLRRPHQPARGSRGQIGDGLTLTHGHRAPRHEHQP